MKKKFYNVCYIAVPLWIAIIGGINPGGWRTFFIVLGLGIMISFWVKYYKIYCKANAEKWREDYYKSFPKITYMPDHNGLESFILAQNAEILRNQRRLDNKLKGFDQSNIKF